MQYNEYIIQNVMKYVGYFFVIKFFVKQNFYKPPTKISQKRFSICLESNFCCKDGTVPIKTPGHSNSTEQNYNLKLHLVTYHFKPNCQSTS